MKTIEVKVYQFSELDEQAKQKAIEKLAYINVEFDWWDGIYDDAKTIGLKITGFDIDRGSYCNGEFLYSAAEVAQDILNNHGEPCETYKTAQNFLEKHNPIFAAYLDETSEKYETRETEDELQEIEDEFLKSLLEDYRIILSNEYDYLTSKKAIIETIEANKVDFLESGKRY